ncbi:MAG: glyceraldehyde-3-phosphate dehydrogenase [Proteobacteria bacterium]|nr:glyceraldehyde-3-phosphate dehydrogenase [Pseudomonadota bacterium]
MARPVTLAINGLGRIGRTVLRQIAGCGDDAFRIVAVNDIADIDMIEYLLRFDSVFGPFPGRLERKGDDLSVNGRIIRVSRAANLSEVDLTGVDVLLECIGKAQTRDWAMRGLTAGAASVLISGPSPAADVTVVLGANDDRLGDARIVSNASCTTNALAPLLAALDAAWGVESAHMTTIHCYTGSQPTIDAPRDDPARSRAAALSMVPTTTSATRLIDTVLPHLAGRISGAAVRVPVASVSAIDLVVQARTLPEGDLTGALRAMAEASPVMGWTDWPNVSSDLRARPESVILALPETERIGEHQLRVFGWYDNEWGFSARMLDMAARMAARKP